jgi:hypothetical protein
MESADDSDGFGGIFVLRGYSRIHLVWRIMGSVDLGNGRMPREGQIDFTYIPDWFLL